MQIVSWRPKIVYWSGISKIVEADNTQIDYIWELIETRYLLELFTVKEDGNYAK